MKNNKIINYSTIAIYMIIFISLATIYSFLITKDYMPHFIYIDIEQTSIRDLINTIWQVQAAISLLSITLVSLMINKLEIRFYGITLKDILLIREKLYHLNYWDKVSVCIFLIICNFYYITKGILSGATFVFLINAIFIMLIYIDTFRAIVEAPKYMNIAKEYILNQFLNYLNNEKNNVDSNQVDKDITYLTENLYIYSINLIQKHSLIHLRSNLEFLFFLRELITKNNERSKILSMIEKNYIGIIQNMVENDDIFEVKSIIIDICERMTDFEGNEFFIQRLLEPVVEGTLLFKHKYQFEKYDFKSLIVDLTVEISGEIKILNIQSISLLLNKYFVNIQNNNLISQADKKELNRRFIKWVTHVTFIKENTDEFQIHKEVIYYIAKYAIKNNYSELFGILISDAFIDNRLGLTEPYKNKVIELLSNICVYIYYVSMKETYYKQDYKEDVKKYVFISNIDNTTDKPCLADILRSSYGQLWNFYSSIRNELTNKSWEITPLNDCKTCIMDTVIDEFFVFYSLWFDKDFTGYQLEINGLDKNRIRILLEFFNSNGMLKIEHENSFKEFCRWLDISNKVVEPNSNFYEYLNANFKQSVLKEVQSHRKMTDIILTKENEIRIETANLLKSNIFYSDNIIEKDAKELITTESFPVGILTGDIILIGDIGKGFLKAFEGFIFDKIKNNCISFKSNHTEKGKIAKFLDLVNNIKKQNDLHIDSYINRKVTQNLFINYYEDSDQQHILEDFENSVHFLGNLYNVYYTVFIDSKKVDIKMEFVSADFRDIKPEEIDYQLQHLEKDGEYYLIDIVNNVKVHFTKEEAEVYYKENTRILDVKCKIYHNIQNPCGIIIEHNTK